MMESIVSGIIAGLLTTLLVFLAHNIFRTKLQPWYSELIYRDAKIEGRWKNNHYVDFNDEMIDESSVISGEKLLIEEQIELSRKGHFVTGYLTVLSGPDKGESYWLNGEFRNLILTCEYSSVYQDSLDRGNYCLMLKDNGRKLIGISSFLVDSRNEIDSEFICWEKNIA